MRMTSVFCDRCGTSDAAVVETEFFFAKRKDGYRGFEHIWIPELCPKCYAAFIPTLKMMFPYTKVDQ